MIRKRWEPPKLLDGADVLQTYWLVQVPWNAALIGLPSGWADENRWYWDLYVWKRRPVATLGELIGWVTKSTATSTEPAEPVADRNFHGYLFGRAGPPSAMNAWIASRPGSSSSARAWCWLWGLRRPSYGWASAGSGERGGRRSAVGDVPASQR